MHDFFQLRIRFWGLLTAGGFLGVVGSVSGFFGQWAWWMDLGSHFRVQYVFLFLVLAACYFAGKKRAWAGGCLVLAVLNVVPVAAFLLPIRPYDTGPGPSLRVALLNVNTQQGRPGEVARFLRREDPDIVILEEINEAWMRQLSDALQAYPTRLVETRDDNFGLAFLTRLETVATQLVYFGSADVPSIVADLRCDGHPFKLVATHPLPPGGAEFAGHRNRQLESLASYVQTNRGELAVCGDLNVSPWSPHYRSFLATSGLINSSQGRALHTTWPSFSPLFRIPIDHCLHSAGIAIRAKRVGESVGSDHLPVIVDLVLRARERT